MPAFSPPLRLGLVLERLAFGAFVLLGFLFPFERMEPVIVLTGLEKITTAELPMRVGTALWLLSLLAAWRRPRLPRGLALPALLWLALMAASALAAPQYSAEAARFTLRMALALLAGWAVYDLLLVDARNAPAPGRRWRWLAQAMTLAGTAVALIGLLEASQNRHVLDWLRPFKGAPTRVGDILRVSSTLPYATIAAMVLEMTLPLALTWAVTAKRRWTRVMLALGLLAGLAALALTLTRAGVLALLAALLLMAVVGWRAAVGGRPFDSAQDGPFDSAQDGPFDSAQDGQGDGGGYTAGTEGRDGSRTALRQLALGSLAAAGALIGLVLLILLYNPTAGLRLRTETEQSWYQAAYRVADQLTLPAAAVTTTPVVVVNTSVRQWEAGGPNPFQLSYHLLQRDGRQVQYDGPRSPLPGSIPAGGQVEVEAFLQAPSQPGEYIVEWDMVQEGVAWFSWKGAAPARTRLVVIASDEASVQGPIRTPTTGQVMRIPPPGRLDLWRAALRMTVDHPLLGVGPDNFRLVYGPYAGVENWDPNVHANNLYIEWLAGTGMLGLVTFLWLNGAILWRAVGGGRQAMGTSPARGRRWVHRLQAAGGAWRLAVLAGLAAWFVHGLLDSFYEFTPTYAAFWLLAALGVAAWDRD